MTRGSSPTAEQVQRVKLTLAKPGLSAEKGKKFVINNTTNYEGGGEVVCRPC